MPIHLEYKHKRLSVILQNGMTHTFSLSVLSSVMLLNLCSFLLLLLHFNIPVTLMMNIVQVD